MAFNEVIELRIKEIVDDWQNVTSKKMFGGVGYMLSGNMVCGVHKEFLVLRMDPNDAEIELKAKHAKPFDITGRPMKGWIMMDQDGFKTQVELEKILIKAKVFVDTLHRNRGIGRALFEALLKEIDEMKVKAFLTVDPVNKHAIGLYEKWGFTERTFVQGFYGSGRRESGKGCDRE